MSGFVVPRFSGARKWPHECGHYQPNRLATVPVRVPVADIYRGVELPEEPPR